jgi:hypothetical protein
MSEAVALTVGGGDVGAAAEPVEEAGCGASVTPLALMTPGGAHSTRLQQCASIGQSCDDGKPGRLVRAVFIELLPLLIERGAAIEGRDADPPSRIRLRERTAARTTTIWPGGVGMKGAG